MHKLQFTFPNITGMPDINKRWLIDFYTSKDGKEWTRHKLAKYKQFSNGNKIQDGYERRKHFEQLKDLVVSDLKGNKFGVEKVVTDRWDIFEKEVVTNARINHSERTIKRIKTAIQRLAIVITKPSLVTKEIIVEYLTKAASQHTNEAFNHNLRYLKLAYKLINKEFPGAGVKSRKVIVKSSKALSMEEVRYIMSEIKTYNQNLFLAANLTYFCVLRSTEIAKLKWDDIDNKVITIRAEISKVSNVRQVPMSVELMRVLSEVEKKRVYLFDNKGKHVNEDYFKKLWQRFAKARNIDRKFTLYALKHTACAELYKKTKDIILIKNMCGHTKISTTELYLKSIGIDYTCSQINQIPTFDV